VSEWPAPDNRPLKTEKGQQLRARPTKVWAASPQAASWTAVVATSASFRTNSSRNVGYVTSTLASLKRDAQGPHSAPMKHRTGRQAHRQTRGPRGASRTHARNCRHETKRSHLRAARWILSCHERSQRCGMRASPPRHRCTTDPANHGSSKSAWSSAMTWSRPPSCSTTWKVSS
jgi:hypothetical protein